MLVNKEHLKLSEGLHISRYQISQIIESNNVLV